MQQPPNGHAWNEDFQSGAISFPPISLHEFKQVLSEDLPHFFNEVNVDIVSCPALMKEPYNLAAMGLGGITTIYQCGNLSNLYPRPQQNKKWDLKKILSRYCYDSFVIGAGYAAKPHMPYNGHFVINATFKAPNQFNNASRIVFMEEDNGRERIKFINNPNHMTCSMFGNFFVSEGRQERVLRVRVKGHTTRFNIITTIKTIISVQFFIRRGIHVGLGGVLVMNKGKVVHSVTRENYPQQFLSFDDFIDWFHYPNRDCTSEVIAVGALTSQYSVVTNRMRHGFYLTNEHEVFHSFSNYGVGGQLIGGQLNTTPDETEYEGYFNVANNLYYLPNSV